MVEEHWMSVVIMVEGLMVVVGVVVVAARHWMVMFVMGESWMVVVDELVEPERAVVLFWVELEEVVQVVELEQLGNSAVSRWFSVFVVCCLVAVRRLELPAPLPPAWGGNC